MTKDRSRADLQSGQHELAAGQFGDAEIEEASQRVGPLAEIPGLLRDLGVDPAEVAAAAGLAADALDTMENRIPYVAAGRLFRECVRQTGCQHFGLLVGQRTRLSHLGLPGLLIRYSPTLGAAMRTFAVYQHLNSHGMAKFLLEKDGVATLGSFVYQKGTERVDLIYELDASATLSVIRELFGNQWRPERVLLSSAKPTDVGLYRRFFGAPCRFGCLRTALLFPASELGRRLASADPEELRILEAQAHVRDDFGLVSRLRRTLRTLLLAKAPSGDEVARLLSMHHRTLNRRLKGEGTTFREVLEEVRFDAACQFLDSGRTPITEIAASLGYAETSAFSRAFRRWSGATPVERRRGERRLSHARHAS